MMKKEILQRKKLEVLVVLILLVCGLSVLSLIRKKEGALTYADGTISYTGDIVNNRMNGQGTLVYSNGDTYTGDFVDGVFQGTGTYTSSTGWSYTGDLKNGQPDGQGTLVAQTGDVYEGTFKQGIYQDEN